MSQKIQLDENQKILDFYKNREELNFSDKISEARKIIDQQQEVDVDEAFILVEKRINHKHFIGRIYTQLNRHAAIWFIPLLLLAAWGVWENLLDPSHRNFTGAVQEIDCPVGVRSHVILPDGTKMWLNSGSKIKYRLPFNDENRLVELQGEAFLDVAKIKNSDFMISSGNVDIKVLGTQFDFKSYPDDRRVEVSLLDGKIDLQINNQNNEIRKATLKPGDHLSYNRNDGSTVLENKNLGNYIAWKQNRLVFEETPLKEVAKELERWYGVKSEITNKELLTYKFTTTFENEPLSQVIELLELSSPIQIKYIPKDLSASSASSQKAKIIFFKN